MGTRKIRPDRRQLLKDGGDIKTLLDKVEELQHNNSQLIARLQKSEIHSAELKTQLMQATKEIDELKENLQESCSQVSALQQREREQELDRESEKDREQLNTSTPQTSSELDQKIQELQDKGLIRLGSSASGALDIQVVPVTVVEYVQAPTSASAAPDYVIDTPSPASIVPASAPPPPSIPPSGGPGASPAPPPPPPYPLLSGVPPLLPGAPNTQSGLKGKKPIQTKFRMPFFNWQVLKPNQVKGTVFNELDDEQILEELNMDIFEEQFKTKAQGNPGGQFTLKKKAVQKTSLINTNKAKNLAITLHKGGMNPSKICTAIEMYDQKSLSVVFLELLKPFIPSDFEMKLLVNYENDGRPLEDLADEDQFMLRFGKIPHLSQQINTLTFVGNFPDTVKRLQL
ncbi:formin-like protein 1, partial [Scomber scombrus]